MDVTFSEAMGTGVTTAANYTVSGTGKGTLATNPDSVTFVSGSKYRLTWNSGEMYNGGDITIAVATAQDTVGNAVSSSGTHTGGATGTSPSVTGLSNDAVATQSKTWNWGCSETCTYRYTVDTTSNTAPSGAYGATTTATQNTGTATYYLHVQARDAAGNESTVVHVSAVLDNTQAGAFDITSATAGVNKVTLAWSASTGATSYTIKYGTSTGSYGTTFSTSATSPTVVTGLNAGTPYYFMVTAVKAAGNRDATSEATATPLAPDYIDDDNTTRGFGGGTKIGVQWNTNSTNKLILGPDTDCDGNMSEGETIYTNCAEFDSSWTPQWSSLVSYWKMNESSWNGTAGEVRDSKGSNHGKSLGGATTVSAPSAHVGPRAGSFDGTNDYVEVTDAATLDFGSGDFTVQAWIYKTSNCSLFDNSWGVNKWNTGSAPGTNEWSLGTCDTTGNANAFAFTVEVGSTVYRAEDDRGHRLNTWNHVVGIRRGTTIELYVNGVSATNATSIGTGTVSINNVTGRNLRFANSALNDLHFAGRIDEVAIWSTALSATEVQQIFSRQSAEYSGSFISRVVDHGSSIQWDGLKWLTTLPFGKEITGDANASGSITAADSETSADYPSLVGSDGSTSDNDLMTNLVGLWRLNGTLGTIADDAVIADASGNGNHGVAKDSSTTNTIKFDYGKFSQAVTFDGTNDYIDLGTLGTFGTQVGTSTVSVWIKSTASAQGAVLKVIDGASGSSSTNDPAFGIELNTALSSGCTTAATAGRTLFYIRDKTGKRLARHITTTINEGKWHHIVWRVIDGSANSMEVYVDGVSQALNGSCSESPSSYQNWTRTLALGAQNNRTTRGLYFPGSIDEVAIWDRALHPDEIKQLYRRGANRLKFQVRTCTASDCSDGATWLGNDNSKDSYFSELHNYAPYNYNVNNCSATNLILTGSPSLLFACFTGALSNLSSSQNIQYRVILESDDLSTNCDYGSGATWCSPELKSVELKP